MASSNKWGMLNELMARMMAGEDLYNEILDLMEGELLRGFGAMRRRGSDPYMVLGLDRSAPDEVVKAAYKALSAKYHPDKGGDPEKMKLVNAAYDQVCRERGWKSTTGRS